MTHEKFTQRAVTNAVLYSDNGESVGTIVDPVTDEYALVVAGQVAISRPSVPTGFTGVILEGNNPLSFKGNANPQRDDYVIGVGKSFALQCVEVGSESELGAGGARVDVVYYDGAVDHLISRVYSNGTTYVFTHSALTARDGERFDGDGATKYISILRYRLSNADLEIDAVVRGYEYDTPA